MVNCLISFNVSVTISYILDTFTLRVKTMSSLNSIDKSFLSDLQTIIYSLSLIGFDLKVTKDFTS